MKIGFLGAGNIAGMVAPAVSQVEQIECYAVAARDKDRADAFAKKWGFQKSYGSYEELMRDPEVDVIYVGTPHSHHYEQMLDALRHGKGVIGEKAFCINCAQAEHIQKYAKENKLFAAEAIWPRYMPSRKVIRDLIDSGIVGEPSVLTANLFYNISGIERITNPALAGGALLDVGIYTLNFALMCFGNDIQRIESSIQKHETGVDAIDNITIYFQNGRVAMLSAGIYSRSDRKGIIHGTKGYIVVENINNPQSVSVYDTEDNLVQKVEFPQKVNGYEYEFEEMAKAFDAGKTGCESMPMDETVFVLSLCDQLRKQWGLKYPQEV